MLSIERTAERFGDRIREERKRLGLSQATVAARCGVSRAAHGAYELGVHHPTAAYLQAFGAAGADILYVVSGQRLADVAEAPLDWELIEVIFPVIEQWAAARGRPTLPETKIKLLKAIYEHARRVGQHDRVFLEDALQLVA